MDPLTFATILAFFVTVIALVAMTFGERETVNQAIQALSDPLKAFFKKKR